MIYKLFQVRTQSKGLHSNQETRSIIHSLMTASELYLTVLRSQTYPAGYNRDWSYGLMSYMIFRN